MRRILVTGGAGYVGSRLIRLLARSADDVVVRVLDNLQGGGYRALMSLEGRPVEFLEGDILDPVAVRRALDGAEAVAHLASIVRTPLSFQHTRWTEQVNHWGTARLVEACLEARVPRFVFASSFSVYGPCEDADERTVCRPVGPYASSKLAAEKVVAAAASRGLVPTILRLGTVFGEAPVVRFDSLANRMAYLAGTGRTLTVYGNGGQMRPLTHVDDAASSITFCLEHQEETAGGTFNVLTTNASVLDVARVAEQARPGTRVRFTEQDVRTHISFTMDGKRLGELGWSPSCSLRDGVTEMVRRFGSVTTPRPEGGRGLENEGLEDDEWQDG